MENNYLVKRKHEGKFLTFGNVKKNQYGNFSLGMKVGPLLKDLVANAKDGEWLNWSLFTDDGEKREVPAKLDESQEIQF